MVWGGERRRQLRKAPIAILHPNVRGPERKDWGCRETSPTRRCQHRALGGTVTFDLPVSTGRQEHGGAATSIPP
jgi:hypothetical protein